MKLFKVFSVLIVIVMFCSCASVKRSTSTSFIHDTIVRDNYIEKLKYDSIYLHDSIYMYMKGDTVFVYRDKYQYKYKYIFDTLAFNDTVYINRVETKEVIKKENNLKYRVWNICLLVLCIILIILWIKNKIQK